MEKNILVILMFAFGIFAIVMFILFFIYLKKYYNNKSINDDYEKDIDQDTTDNDEDEVPPILNEVPPITPVDVIEPEIIEPSIPEEPKTVDIDSEMEFIPKKKK